MQIKRVDRISQLESNEKEKEVVQRKEREREICCSCTQLRQTLTMRIHDV